MILLTFEPVVMVDIFIEATDLAELFKLLLLLRLLRLAGVGGPGLE